MTTSGYGVSAFLLLAGCVPFDGAEVLPDGLGADGLLTATSPSSSVDVGDGVSDDEAGADDPATITVGELTCPADAGWIEDVVCADCDFVVLDVVCAFLADAHPLLIATRTESGWRAFSPEVDLASGDDARLLAAVRDVTGIADASWPTMAFDPACLADGADGASTIALGEGFRFQVGALIDHVACAVGDEPGTWAGGYALVSVRPSCVAALSHDDRWTVEGEPRAPRLRFEGFEAHAVWAGRWADLREHAGIAP